MAKKSDPIINIIELDARDARYQSGIVRYMNVLGAHMPKNVRTFRIMCEYSPEYTGIKMERTDDGVRITYPFGFPLDTMINGIVMWLAPMLSKMENIIIKCNCMGIEALCYAIRARIYCRCIGVLHFSPLRANPNPAGNPFFNMDHIISVCATGKGFLTTLNNRRPVSVIYNGIDAPTVRKKSKATDGVFRFIFPGGWAPHKGFAKIIPAIKRVAATHQIEVLVTGGGDVPDDIRREIDGLPIRVMGYVAYGDEMDKIYAMADCALFASVSEACSFAGIEAMAHNLAIVSNDTPGLREMFGSAALYASVNDKSEINVDEYADRMIQMIDRPRTRTQSAIRAYSQYLRHYTATRMARDTLDLYYRLLGI
ncbi:glycosyltransferase family 4 protein [bacterium]|nr:glycosyltransferase family 4 protein [bacterium]